MFWSTRYLQAIELRKWSKTETMNSTLASGTLFDPQLEFGPRQAGLKQLAPFVFWFPALAAAVLLSIHRVVTCKPDTSSIRFIAFASFFVILVRIGHQSDIWETRP